MEKWIEAESVSKSLTDWLNTVEAEHEDADVVGGSLLTAERVADNYQSKIDDHRDMLDRLRAQTQQLQSLNQTEELPELEETISAIEGRLLDTEQRNEKLSRELQTVHG